MGSVLVWVIMLHFSLSVCQWVTIFLLLFILVYLFSSNFSNPSTGGGTSLDLCRSNSLGTSHSIQGRDDSSSSSTAGLYCTVLHCTIYRCAVRPYIAINISIRYGSEWVTFAAPMYSAIKWSLMDGRTTHLYI